MRFGYYILNTYVPELDGPARSLYAHYLDQVDRAEALGFDSVWVTEHHFRPFGGMVPSPQLLLAAFAQRTRRIRLGTSVVLLPLHHPLRIAEEMGMLDILSGGRINFGVGRGMPGDEHDLFGSDWSTAQARLQEGVQLIRQAWLDPELRWQGNFYRFDGVTALPQPVQRPHPPIWMAATGDPESFRWIGQQGFHLMTLPWLFPAEEIRARIGVYRQALQEAGHDPAQREVFVMYPAHVAETATQARHEAEEPWLRWRAFALAEVNRGRGEGPALAERLSYERMVADHNAPFGDPDQCIRQLAWARDTLGATHVGLTFHFGGLAPDLAIRSMQLFSRHVAPRLRG